MHDADGKIVKWFGTCTDIDELKQTQERLGYMALHDPLTDLPNRLLLTNRLKVALPHAERHHQQVALLFWTLTGSSM